MGKGSKGQEGNSLEINDEGVNGARRAHVYQFVFLRIQKSAKGFVHIKCLKNAKGVLAGE